MCSEVTVNVWGIHVASPEEEKEMLRWEGFAEKECFELGIKESVGDGKLIIISTTVSSITPRRFFSTTHNKCTITRFSTDLTSISRTFSL